MVKGEGKTSPFFHKGKIVFEKLTPNQLNALYDKIEWFAIYAMNGAKDREPLKIYKALDELEFFRRQLQSHFAAVEVEKST